jgi:hypothetical protein
MENIQMFDRIKMNINIRDLIEKYSPITMSLAIIAVLISSMTSGEDAMLNSVIIQIGWCKSQDSVCLFSWHIGLILFFLVLGVVLELYWLNYRKNKELSKIRLDKYYDVPLPSKSGIVINNGSDKNYLKDVEIELLKVSQCRKYPDDEIEEIVREGALQNNFDLGRWENGKNVVSPRRSEPIYFFEIVDNKAMLLLKHEKEYENNHYFDGRLAESFFEIIFVIKGFLGEHRYFQKYSAIFKYRSTKIVVNNEVKEIISTIDIEQVIPMENNIPVF